MKFIKKMLVVMAIATLILTITVATASATTDVKNEKADNGIAIESKEKKVSSYKVTWNYNGGKIGSKKTKVTTVKKGSKIGKLVATPKRSGYTFRGWYTKKSGGTKISANTKPKKGVTYFAHWNRGSTSTSSKLVGVWKHDFINAPKAVSYDFTWGDYHFYADGRFEHYYIRASGFLKKFTGTYSVSNGKVYFKERKFYKYEGNSNERYELLKKYGSYQKLPNHVYGLIGTEPDMISEYKISSDKGTYLKVMYQEEDLDPNNVYTGVVYRKK